MPNTAAVTAQKVEFITKDEAAAALGVSSRRVLEFAQAGILRSQRLRNPATKLFQVKLHAGDVERMRQERTRPQPRTPDPKTLAPAQNPKNSVSLSAQPPHHLPHHWLNLAEAAAYTRLPESILTTLIHLRQLPALDVGVRAGGRYRVKCSDLDAIQGLTTCGNEDH